MEIVDEEKLPAYLVHDIEEWKNKTEKNRHILGLFVGRTLWKYKFSTMG